MKRDTTVGMLLLLVVVLAEPLFSQPVIVSGNVRDAWSLVVIDSARIEIINVADPFESYITYSDVSGNWSLPITTDVGEKGLLPEAVTLQQNYPNPFNPSTQLEFSIPQAGSVTLSVHTILGELLDERRISLTPGRYNIEWQGKGAAGVLLYSISFNQSRLTRKMVQLDGSGVGGFGVIRSLSSGQGQSAPSRPVTSLAQYKVTASRFDYEPDSTTIVLVSGVRADFLLESVHRRAFLIDLHNDVLEKVVEGYQLGPLHAFNHSDIPRFRSGGVDAQLFSCWASPSQFPTTAYQRTIEMMDSFAVQIGRNPTTLAQARTADEADSIAATGRLAGVLVVEGGHSIENSLDKLITLFNRGARYLTITWNNSTPWAIAAADPLSPTVGLSPFGFEVIHKMDSLGIIIDVSHTGIKTIEDILATTTNPIIASHSGVRALRNHYRNLWDNQIVAIAQNGGVIGIVFYPPFLSASGTVTIDTVMRHLDYIVNLVGVDHVAIGSDFDGIETTPVGLEDVSRFPNLTVALLRRGYSREEVQKILGGNFMRVFRQVTANSRAQGVDKGLH